MFRNLYYLYKIKELWFCVQKSSIWLMDCILDIISIYPCAHTTKTVLHSKTNVELPEFSMIDFLMKNSKDIAS